MIVASFLSNFQYTYHKLYKYKNKNKDALFHEKFVYFNQLTVCSCSGVSGLKRREAQTGSKLFFFEERFYVTGRTVLFEIFGNALFYLIFGSHILNLLEQNE